MKKQRKTDNEPIAVVGMAFRFPGNIDSEQRFWQVLEEGEEVIGRIGSDRWAVDELAHPSRPEPGRSITFAAGALSDVAGFDAGFFGISPREAGWLDPQQRLLLELAWEAMENGGHSPDRMAGSGCSVFVGMSSLDYGVRGIADLASFSAHSMTGNTLSMGANRLSYMFDLRGPSLTVDTACSSALVALHQACCSLRSGESPMAMVGSVNLLLHPYPFVGFTKASMISANGRCRTFDASADGYVRSEGGAVLLLKPLSQAKADGDTIHAVILGSGVNADGSRKTGITIPSSEGQADLMRGVCRQVGMAPDDIDYLEAHGTGTAVGDPVETRAIGEVYGHGRHAPLPVGSVKTNVGHLEAASGMAGLIKTILMLKRGTLVPSLHCHTPNPHIPFAELNIKVVTKTESLEKEPKAAAVMAVNSFGFGGTNAHVILQSGSQPKPPVRKNAAQAIPPLFLSARTDEALRALAHRYADLLQSPDAPHYYDVAYSAAFHRAHLGKRLAVAAVDAGSVAQKLAAFAKGESAAGMVCREPLPEDGRIAFIYTGNGAHWAGMGQQLLTESAEFAAVIGDIDGAMRPYTGFSLIDEINAPAECSRFDDTKVTQPVLFAIQVAVTQWLRARGIHASAVAGHSVGEVAAVWAAGILDLPQAIRLVCARSVAQAETRGDGRMAAVGLSESAMQELLDKGYYTTLEIAGINSPANITISGSLQELQALQRELEANHTFFRMLDLDYAFHSRSMDPVRGLFLEQLGALKLQPPQADFVSTVTGAAIDSGELTPSYWWDNIRKPVRFASGIEALAGQGCRIFVEIGPHAILKRYVSECLTAAKTEGHVLVTLRRHDDGLARLDEAALDIHLLAKQPQLAAYFPKPGHFVTLPNYPWQRERHWLPESNESSSAIERKRVHPLLGWRLKEHEACWENVIDTATCPYLEGHRVADAIVFPAAATVEIALAAAKEWYGSQPVELEECEIVAPIVLNREHACALRVELTPRSGQLRVFSRERLSHDAWALHASCRLLGAPTHSAMPSEAPLARIGSTAVDATLHYRLTEAVGLDYGAAFQGFAGGMLSDKTLDGALVLPVNVPQSGYYLHPVLLDTCFQSLVHFFREAIEGGHGAQLLPVKVGRLRFFGGVAARFELQLLRASARSVRARVVLLTADHSVVGICDGCVFRASAFQHKKMHVPAQWRMAATYLPHPADTVDTTRFSVSVVAQQARQAMADSGQRAHRQAYYRDALPLLDALVTAFMYEAINRLNADRRDWLAQALADDAAIPVEARPYFAWLVQVMRATQLLKQKNGVWYLDDTNPPPPADSVWQTLLAEFPAMAPELAFIGRVGRHLPAIFTHEGEAQALLASIERSHLFELLFDETPACSAANRGLMAAITQQVRSSAHHVRLLYVSGGASEFSHTLVTQLASLPVSIVIAEPDAERLTRMKAEYHGHAGVTVVAMDKQGALLAADKALPGVFDLVVAHHWLHRNPQAAVWNALRSRLVPGGAMMVAERHPDYAVDFIFGLSPQWWREGHGQPRSSLMTPTELAARLLAAGFSETDIVLEPAHAHAHGTAYLICATHARPAASVTVASAARWCIVCDEKGASHSLAVSLADELSAAGHHALLMPASWNSREEAALALEDNGRIDHVVYLAGLQAAMDASQEIRCIRALHLIQALPRFSSLPKLWLVTAGGALMSQVQSGWNAHPAEAALWGVGRVAMNEYPALATTMIDLAGDVTTTHALGKLRRELLTPDGESEIVLAGGARFGLRMQASHAVVDEQGAMARFRLDFQTPGQLRKLQWMPLPQQVLGDDEIELKPAAVGLNFRDVMYAMGLLPDEAVENGFSGASLGLECAGVVSRVGKAVRDLRVGDAVMGFGPACFSSHVVTKAGAVARKPEAWSFVQAASVPTAFFTVYYALKTLADLQPGEKLLIHGAAGGVGIAAIQIAKYFGAEIFATAGSEEKRDFVALLGADHVFDSRSLAFADDILAATNSEGVDVVLNSLAGEAINRNLRVLKPFGRFLELGKRDFFENTHIGLRPFKDNISYFGIDADQLLVARPKLAQKLFAEVMALFVNGTLFPLPHQVFSADRVVDAFRTMQQSRHIGKIIVDLENAKIPLSKREETPHLALRRDATYLVTGGLSGFGLETARWLARHGAGHLVLLSRRGMQTPGAHEAVASLEALDAKVHVHACDITDARQMDALAAQMAKELPPVRGIVHAAMVLDDGLIQTLDAERFTQVLQPKVKGAWHLHRISEAWPLDHFILYSSITTLIGNPGQVNYVAANAYLESLALWRRERGLTAHCISWGPIGDAGYLARNTAVKDSLTARLGATPLDSQQALAQLPQLLATAITHTAVADLNFATLARVLPSASASRFEDVRQACETSEFGDDDTVDIRCLLEGKTIEEAQTIIQQLLLAEAGKILSVSPERINTTAAMHDLGMDSLMAVELVLAIEQRFNIQLSAMELSAASSSIERISLRIAEKLVHQEAPQGSDELSDRLNQMLQQHGADVSVQAQAETIEELKQAQKTDAEAAA